MLKERLELRATRDGNAIIGSFYRVTAWRGEDYLGEGIYSGYTKAESLRLARESVKERGGLGIFANA
jgi:hypothetical protein